MLLGKQQSTSCSQVQTSRRVAITDHVLTRTPPAWICAEHCMQLSIHQEYQRYSWEDEAASGGCSGRRSNLPRSVFPRRVKALTQGKWLKPVEGLSPLFSFYFFFHRHFTVTLLSVAIFQEKRPNPVLMATSIFLSFFFPCWNTVIPPNIHLLSMVKSFFFLFFFLLLSAASNYLSLRVDMRKPPHGFQNLDRQRSKQCWVVPFKTQPQHINFFFSCFLVKKKKR